MNQTPLPIAVLISGSGSNLQALIDACNAPGYPAVIRCVISNKADAYGVVRAQNAGIPVHILSHKDYPDRESYDRALDACIRQYDVKLVCLAGFMRLLTSWFVEQWRDQLINIHPSLLPSFKGTHAQAQAFAAGVKVAGCTVHIVRPEMDSGPIIMQAIVTVGDDDTLETLTARIFTMEHRCYPLAVQWIAEGKLTLKDERVFRAPSCNLPIFCENGIVS